MKGRKLDSRVGGRPVMTRTNDDCNHLIFSIQGWLCPFKTTGLRTSTQNFAFVSYPLFSVHTRVCHCESLCFMMWVCGCAGVCVINSTFSHPSGSERPDGPHAGGSDSCDQGIFCRPFAPSLHSTPFTALHCLFTFHIAP